MTSPTTLTIPAPAFPAIGHLIEHSALRRDVTLGYDGGQHVARLTSPRLSDGQTALWEVCAFLANHAGSLILAASHPSIDAESRAAIDGALRIAFAGVAV